MRAQFVFEKFSIESDPIVDMDIGTGNIDNLKYGNVLRAKHEFEIMDEDHNNYLRRVYIAGFGASLDFRSIDKDIYIVVLKAQYENNVVKVYYSKSTGGLSGAKRKKEFIDLHVSSNTRVKFADNFFRTPQENMNKYFEFITFDE